MTIQEEWIHRSVVVTAEIAPMARAVAAQLGPSSQGMFTAALCPIGQVGGDPTHFISAGLMAKGFAEMLESAEALVAGALAAGVEVPLAMAEMLLSTSDISDEHGLTACARLGLELHGPDKSVSAIKA